MDSQEVFEIDEESEDKQSFDLLKGEDRYFDNQLTLCK
jgi:hypothetical protein